MKKNKGVYKSSKGKRISGNKKYYVKHILASVLIAVSMTLSYLPGNALAQNYDNTPVKSDQTEQVSTYQGLPALSSYGSVTDIPLEEITLERFQNVQSPDAEFWHASVSLDGNPEGEEWEDIPHYTDLETAIANSVIDNPTTKTINLHIFEGDYLSVEEGIYGKVKPKSNMVLVGQYSSIIEDDYSKGINEPTHGAFIRNVVEAGGKSNIIFANLIFNPDIDGGAGSFENCNNITFYNNYLAGISRIGKLHSGVMIGQFTKEVLLYNNVINKMHKESDPVLSCLYLWGQGIKLRSNIFSESDFGISGYDTAYIDLGKEAEAGNNVFVGNNVFNGNFDIGEFNISAEFNTWYDVGETGEMGWGEPLTTEEEIKTTIDIKTPTTSQSTNNFVTSEVKDVDVVPFKTWDKRFSGPPSAVRYWKGYH